MVTLQSARMLRLRWWISLAAILFVGQHILRWGRPVPAHYVLKRDDHSAANRWLVERLGDSPETWEARDVDGDGVIDEYRTPAGSFSRPGRVSPPKRWLAICLDGVPLSVMERLWARGHFREFYPPSAVISSFPSDSEAALTEALHAEAVPGYEHRYFDRARNRVRGGAWVTLTGRNIPYLQALNYDAAGWFKGLHYVVPRRSYRADLGRLRKHFLASREKVFLAHLSASDSLFHIFTPAEMEPLLLEVEDVVRDLYLGSRGELGVILWSDHGNTMTPSTAVPLADHLERRGWRLGERLEGPRDVVVPAYGLVGFLAVYCRTEATRTLAEDLTRLEGADLVIFTDPKGIKSDAVTILNTAGARAQLGWSRDGRRFTYAAENGDPLGFLTVFERLRATSRHADDTSVADEDLFVSTTQAHYPDAAWRLRGWATNHVQNRANILVSLRPGFFYGSGVFQHIVQITGTHGGLDAPSSLGFAMGTDSRPPAVRLMHLLPQALLKRPTKTTSLAPPAAAFAR